MRLFLFLIYCFALSAEIEDHYKKLENKRKPSTFRGIDYIYLINLDQRKERWIESLKQLVPYGIIPQRFPAIYGWNLKPDVLTDIGLKFAPGMWTGKENVMVFPPEKEGEPDFIFLSGSWNGKACFSGWTVKGTIGCTLSHLSVLKDAYESGYETIWILEDDFNILQNPHLLSDRISELDTYVGKDSWDVLYTDYDYLVVDPNQDILTQVPSLWRPDMPYLDISYMGIHVSISDHLMKIGSRMRAHSIIYRRCGIEKILQFYHTYSNFLPYDQELALIPGMNMFVVIDSIVSYQQVTSDTRYKYF